MTDNQTDDTYNGWPNRETWAIHLHLTNDEAMYHRTNELLGETCAEATGHLLEDFYADPTDGPARRRRHRIANCADALRGMVDGMLDPGETWGRDVRLMVADVGSTWRIDWHHLAENMLEDLHYEGEPIDLDAPFGE